MKKYIIVLLSCIAVSLAMAACGTTKTVETVELEKKEIKTKDVEIDFIKCKAPADWVISIDKIGWKTINFGYKLWIKNITKDNTTESMDEFVSSIKTLFSLSEDSVVIYNGIKYYKSISDDSTTFWFTKGESLVEINAICYDGIIDPKTEIVLKSLVYNIPEKKEESVFKGVQTTPSQKGSMTKEPETSTFDTTYKSTGGDVQVKGYYRKDGTYVKPHTRSKKRK